MEKKEKYFNKKDKEIMDYFMNKDLSEKKVEKIKDRLFSKEMLEQFENIKKLNSKPTTNEIYKWLITTGGTSSSSKVIKYLFQESVLNEFTKIKKNYKDFNKDSKKDGPTR